MGFQCGIVGLPNVGKSTLFNALTNAGAQSANYPFCTIDPNVGVVALNDVRMEKISELVKPQKKIPTTVEFLDIAGLVKGASKGEGLGNQFLSHIKSVDAICHVVRCFENSDIVHVHGNVDPIRDIEVINTELILADLQSVDKRVEKLAKNSKSGDKQNAAFLEAILPIQKSLNEGKSVRSLELSETQTKAIADLFLITAKPVMYVCNVDEAGLKGNQYTKLVEDFAKTENANALMICGSIESEIAEMAENEKSEFLKNYGLEQSGLDRLTMAGYKLLNLITYFTAGEKEVRAWTILKDTKAPQAAGVIHSDFEKGFIRAEVYHYEDLIKFGSELKVKEAGKFRVEGKDYVVKDGDIMHFLFNV